MTIAQIKKHWLATSAVLALFVTLAVAVGFFNRGTALAACTAQDTSRGTATTTVSVPTAGNYRVWSRIMAPDSTNNSYILEIDGSTCGVVVGDNGSMAANAWTWVDYQNGSASNTINVNLSAGNHTVTMIGREDNVKLDRVILTADTTCVPSGTGDNCADPADTQDPVVSLTAPANNATVSNTQSITATASDDTAVTKVEFYIDGVLKGNDPNGPAYAFSWDTKTTPNGTHTLVAKAYDAAGNIGTSTSRSVTVNNGQPDLVVTGISWTPTSPDTGEAVTFKATVKNQGNVATTLGVEHGVRFFVDGTTATWSGNNTNVSLAPGASITLTANGGPVSNAATWTATAGNHTIMATVDDLDLIDESNEGNNSLSSSMAVSSPDTIQPTVSITAPAAGATVNGNAVAVSATAADTGGSGLARVELYVDGVLKATDTSSPFSFTFDSLPLSNAAHSLTAKAIDGAGNNRTSTAVSVTVNNPVVLKEGDVNGDDRITTADISIIARNFGKTNQTRSQGDLDGNGTVGISDISILARNWGT